MHFQHVSSFAVYMLLMTSGSVQQSALEIFPEFQTLKQELTTLRQDVLLLKSKPAYPSFFALIKPQVRVETGHVYKFDKVINNVGHAYSPATGTFTAPQNGTYYFFTIVPTVKGTELVRNNQRLVQLGANLPYNTHSAQSGGAVTFLNKGDTVSVHVKLPVEYQLPLWIGNADTGMDFYTFGGFLIN